MSLEDENSEKLAEENGENPPKSVPNGEMAQSGEDPGKGTPFQNCNLFTPPLRKRRPPFYTGAHRAVPYDTNGKVKDSRNPFGIGQELLWQELVGEDLFGTFDVNPDPDPKIRYVCYFSTSSPNDPVDPPPSQKTLTNQVRQKSLCWTQPSSGLIVIRKIQKVM